MEFQNPLVFAGACTTIKGGGEGVVPSNIPVHRPNIIVQELNSVPALDEAGTDSISQKGNITGLGRKYYRPGRGRDGARLSERRYYRPWTEILSALDDDIIGLEIFPSLDDNITGLVCRQNLNYH